MSSVRSFDCEDVIEGVNVGSCVVVWDGEMVLVIELVMVVVGVKFYKK